MFGSRRPSPPPSSRATSRPRARLRCARAGRAAPPASRPVSRSVPAGSSSSYSPSSTTSGPTTATGITAAPVCDSCARVQASWSCASGSSPTTLADRLAPRADRLRVVPARPLRSSMAESLFILAPVSATLMDGKALAARIRAEVAREVEELGGLGLATVLVGDDPGLGGLHPAQAPGRDGGRDRAARRAAAGDDAARTSCSRSSPELNADDEVDGILVQLPLPAGHRRGARDPRRSTRSRTSTACTR